MKMRVPVEYLTLTVPSAPSGSSRSQPFDVHEPVASIHRLTVIINDLLDCGLV